MRKWIFFLVFCSWFRYWFRSWEWAIWVGVARIKKEGERKRKRNDDWSAASTLKRRLRSKIEAEMPKGHCSRDFVDTKGTSEIPLPNRRNEIMVRY